jgi:hypothetical protein
MFGIDSMICGMAPIFSEGQDVLLPATQPGFSIMAVI